MGSMCLASAAVGKKVKLLCLFGDGELQFFFFQAEDGIRDSSVTGVQTCALPIYSLTDRNQVQPGDENANPSGKELRIEDDVRSLRNRSKHQVDHPLQQQWIAIKIGRASCRERV